MLLDSASVGGDGARRRRQPERETEKMRGMALFSAHRGYECVCWNTALLPVAFGCGFYCRCVNTRSQALYCCWLNPAITSHSCRHRNWTIPVFLYSTLPGLFLSPSLSVSARSVSFSKPAWCMPSRRSCISHGRYQEERKGETGEPVARFGFTAQVLRQCGRPSCAFLHR